MYRELQDEGLVRYVGIARSGAESFAATEQLIKDGLVDFIQVNYSLAEPQAAERLLPFAADNGVAVNINRPFINGRYFGMVSGKQLPEWARGASSFVPLKWSLEIVRGALLHGDSIAELSEAFAWLAAMTIVLLPSGLYASRIAIRRAKQAGSLIQY